MLQCKKKKSVLESMLQRISPLLIPWRQFIVNKMFVLLKPKHFSPFTRVYSFLMKILTSSQDMLYSANTVRHRAAILNKCGQRKIYI